MHLYDFVFPLFVFIAVIFFTSRMATRSEIIAILASGTSYNRMLRPYIVGGILLGLVLWLGNRYLIPRANAIRSTFMASYIDKNDPTKQDERDNDATRIRPEKEKQERPEEPPANPSTGPSNKGVEEPEKGEPYKRTPGQQEPVEDPGLQQPDIKGHNPAEPRNRQNDTTEKDDSGNPVMKRFGKGL